MAQMKVFVSHSHSHNDFCAELVQGLKAAGADVWYDNESMHAGQLGPVIARELRERPVFVVVLSPAALQSRWVEDETRWAYGQLRRDPSRMILPVLAEALPDENDIWLFLQDFQRIEATGLRPFSPTEVVSRTLRALQLTRPGEAPQPTAPQPTESADDLLARGTALNAQRKYTEALPLLQRATQLDPHSFNAWFNYSYTLDDLKRYDEAVAAIDHALVIDPNSTIAWYNKGITLYNLKRYDEALVACDRALAIDPDDAATWLSRGTVLWELKRYDEEIAAYDRALAIDPDMVTAWKYKAITLRAQGRVPEAEEVERRVKALGE